MRECTDDTQAETELSPFILPLLLGAQSIHGTEGSRARIGPTPLNEEYLQNKNTEIQTQINKQISVIDHQLTLTPFFMPAADPLQSTKQILKSYQKIYENGISFKGSEYTKTKEIALSLVNEINDLTPTLNNIGIDLENLPDLMSMLEEMKDLFSEYNRNTSQPLDSNTDLTLRSGDVSTSSWVRNLGDDFLMAVSYSALATSMGSIAVLPLTMGVGITILAKKLLNVTLLDVMNLPDANTADDIRTSILGQAEEKSPGTVNFIYNTDGELPREFNSAFGVLPVFRRGQAEQGPVFTIINETYYHVGDVTPDATGKPSFTPKEYTVKLKTGKQMKFTLVDKEHQLGKSSTAIGPEFEQLASIGDLTGSSASDIGFTVAEGQNFGLGKFVTANDAFNAFKKIFEITWKSFEDDKEIGTSSGGSSKEPKSSSPKNPMEEAFKDDVSDPAEAKRKRDKAQRYFDEKSKKAESERAKLNEEEKNVNKTKDKVDRLNNRIEAYETQLKEQDQQISAAEEYKKENDNKIETLDKKTKLQQIIKDFDKNLLKKNQNELKKLKMVSSKFKTQIEDMQKNKKTLEDKLKKAREEQTRDEDDLKAGQEKLEKLKREHNKTKEEKEKAKEDLNNAKKNAEQQNNQDTKNQKKGGKTPAGEGLNPGNKNAKGEKNINWQDLLGITLKNSLKFLNNKFPEAVLGFTIFAYFLLSDLNQKRLASRKKKGYNTVIRVINNAADQNKNWPLHGTDPKISNAFAVAPSLLTEYTEDDVHAIFKEVLQTSINNNIGLRMAIRQKIKNIRAQIQGNTAALPSKDVYESNKVKCDSCINPKSPGGQALKKFFMGDDSNTLISAETLNQRVDNFFWNKDGRQKNLTSSNYGKTLFYIVGFFIDDEIKQTNYFRDFSEDITFLSDNQKQILDSLGINLHFGNATTYNKLFQGGVYNGNKNAIKNFLKGQKGAQALPKTFERIKTKGESFKLPPQIAIISAVIGVPVLFIAAKIATQAFINYLWSQIYNILAIGAFYVIVRNKDYIGSFWEESVTPFLAAYQNSSDGHATDQAIVKPPQTLTIDELEKKLEEMAEDYERNNHLSIQGLDAPFRSVGRSAPFGCVPLFVL